MRYRSRIGTVRDLASSRSARQTASHGPSIEFWSGTGSSQSRPGRAGACRLRQPGACRRSPAAMRYGFAAGLPRRVAAPSWVRPASGRGEPPLWSALNLDFRTISLTVGNRSLWTAAPVTGIGRDMAMCLVAHQFLRPTPPQSPAGLLASRSDAGRHC